MKTKQLFQLTLASSFLMAFLPIQGAQAAAPEGLLQFTSGGHALGFAIGGMFAATGSHALRVGFTGANPIRPLADSRAGTMQARARQSMVTGEEVQ